MFWGLMNKKNWWKFALYGVSLATMVVCMLGVILLRIEWDRVDPNNLGLNQPGGNIGLWVGHAEIIMSMWMVINLTIGLLFWYRNHQHIIDYRRNKRGYVAPGLKALETSNKRKESK